MASNKNQPPHYMKTRSSNYEKAVRNGMFQQLAHNGEAISVHGSQPTWLPSNTFKHVKLFHRGEKCKIPDGYEYLAVVSELDDCGEWVPNQTLTARTYVELTGEIRQIQKEAYNLVVEGSQWFERLALELGLQVLKSEWGNP